MAISSLLKRNPTSIAKLTKAIDDKNNKGNKYKDDRYWEPTVDKETGVGSATIRFLPQKNSDELPWAEVYSHGFQGPTSKWFIEKSLTTIGLKDPVSEMNSRLWNSGVESDQEVARAYKRKLNYHSNVLVVDDPSNPNNNGKVFLYRYGPKIKEKIDNAIKPKFSNVKSLDPFCVVNGANFYLNIKLIKLGKNMVPNYDDAAFGPKEALYEGEEKKLDAVATSLFSLDEFTDVSTYKTYEQLQTRLYEVLGATVGSGIAVIEGEVAAPRSAAAPKQAIVEQEEAPSAAQRGKVVTPAKKAEAVQESAPADIDNLLAELGIDDK